MLINLMETMFKSEEEWNIVAGIITEMIREKVEEEKILEELQAKEDMD